MRTFYDSVSVDVGVGRWTWVKISESRPFTRHIFQDTKKATRRSKG